MIGVYMCIACMQYIYDIYNIYLFIIVECGIVQYYSCILIYAYTYIHTNIQTYIYVPIVCTKSPGFRPHIWANRAVRSAYEAMLKGTPRPRSAERWYICIVRYMVQWSGVECSVCQSIVDVVYKQQTHHTLCRYIQHIQTHKLTLHIYDTLILIYSTHNT